MGTAAAPGQDCLAGCGLFIRQDLFIYRAFTERCQSLTGNSRLPEGGTQGPTAGGGGAFRKGGQRLPLLGSSPHVPPTPAGKQGSHR